MAQPTLSVIAADTSVQEIFTTNPNGQAASADSQSVVLATDQPPVPVVSATSTFVDRSGTIQTINTNQQIAAPNAARRGFCIENLHATGTLWFNFGDATANQPSFKLAPGWYWETPPGATSGLKISVFSDTAGLTFTAKEW